MSPYLLVASRNTTLAVAARNATTNATAGQGLTLVPFSAQPEPFLTQKIT